MKNKTLIHQIKIGFITGILISSSAACSILEASDNLILNHSFEVGYEEGSNLADDVFNGVVPENWEAFNTGGGRYAGTLGPSLATEVFTPSEAPEGQRVLLLFGTGQQAGSTEFGVEQVLPELAQANHAYSFSVVVGNPATSSAPDPDNLSGFPDYRIEIWVGDWLLAQDWAEHDLAEGTFEKTKLFFYCYEGSDLEGQPITIRLINENNDLNLNEVPGFLNATEVNFDDVQFHATPFGWGVNFEPGPQVFGTLDPGNPKDELELGFSISGKGKKRVLLMGLGQSLHHRIKEVAADPLLSVEKRGRAFARSDDWAFEEDAREIEKIVGELGVESFFTDAGVILELGPGDYVAKVGAKGETGVRAGLRIFDLEPESKMRLSYGTDRDRDFKALWIGKSSLER